MSKENLRESFLKDKGISFDKGVEGGFRADYVEWLEKRAFESEERLREIAYPLDHMRKEAEKDGCVLNGHMAIKLCEDGNYISGLAESYIKSLW